nr:MAG TPA: hypothetical protein [Caudoviricetes sp.]
MASAIEKPYTFTSCQLCFINSLIWLLNVVLILFNIMCYTFSYHFDIAK